ncbi:hypothetical protein KUW00_06545 [Halomonas sp. DP5N14-9]|uniref:hypothetical protein n=1 Tax=Halomonas sp. DP5N14-9 TaxID=2859075 RepID=UPI001C9A167A|nr:hypothetical protein [Halomonas sp. DP5N14-9]MBY5940541.1 hypothetical protein [Halomonas sp. DP5N14-9]
MADESGATNATELTPLQEAVVLVRVAEHLARVLKRLFKELLVVTALPLLVILFCLVRDVRTSALMVLAVLITGYLCSVIWRSWVVREELRAVRKRLAELARPVEGDAERGGSRNAKA